VCNGGEHRTAPRARNARRLAQPVGAVDEAAPGIPTVDEAGVPGAYFLTWYSLWAPKGTPKDIVARLGAAVAAALAGPAIKARFADLGLDVAPPDQQSADGLATFQKVEIDRWWPIVKAANIKME
jgi:tripartite-type tricarboxylate transporter receptor subunit TctC